MRTFAQKTKANQQTTSAKFFTRPSHSHSEQNDTVSSILHLQRKIGNQAVQSSLQSNTSSEFIYDFSRIPVHRISRAKIQPKLKVSTPKDVYEQEADRVADQVMRMSEPDLQHAYPCGGGYPKYQKERTEQVSKQLQTSHVQVSKAGDKVALPTVDDILDSPGLPLEPATADFMEPRFVHDFSQVRVHADARAVKAAAAIGARAFTHRNHIVFGKGQYRPETAAGRRLLAHELTHVIQQMAAGNTANFLEQKPSLVDGRSSPTQASVLYREAAAAVPEPTFSITGTPNVTAEQDGREVNSHSQVSLFLGDFVMDAPVQVQASDTTTLRDWEVGIVQMVSGAVDANCYRRPAHRTGGISDQRVFVERMHAPTQMFHPDRDPTSAVFYGSGSMADLGAVHGGRNSFIVPLHAEDHPGYRLHWGFASAHTSNLDDRDVELFRHRHRGFFYTYVVARQKSTGRLRPLYTVRWWMASNYGYFSPGGGIDFTSTNRKSLTFRLIENHTFTAGDFFPVVTGVTMKQLSRRRQQGWRRGVCPGFVELGGGQ